MKDPNQKRILSSILYVRYYFAYREVKIFAWIFTVLSFMQLCFSTWLEVHEWHIFILLLNLFWFIAFVIKSYLFKQEIKNLKKETQNGHL